MEEVLDLSLHNMSYNLAFQIDFGPKNWPVDCPSATTTSTMPKLLYLIFSDKFDNLYLLNAYLNGTI